MKNLLILSLLIVSYVLYSQDDEAGRKDLSLFNKKNINWHNKDYKKDKIVGSSVERLYKEYLKNLKPKKSIIVAIIDGGVDIYHEDLKDNIWINTDEIPNNGIDDDNNGYIDDINGWNFIGNKKGENLDKAPLEKTRMYGVLDKKYSNISQSEITDKKEYALYLKVKDSFEKDYQKDIQEANSLGQFLQNINMAEDYIKQYLQKDSFTNEDLKAIKTEDADLNSVIEFLTNVYSSGYDKKELKSYKSHIDNELKYNLNIDFHPRADIIGDDCNNYEQTDYGNNNVKGPSSSHGTFGAGVIAAKRNNGIGVQGVADSVKLMVLRVVPDGDEYDKDVALSIKYAVDNGANIINMSFGKDFSVNPHKVWEAVKYASDHNVLLVHAAGNEAENNDTIVHYPTDFVDNTDTVVNYITVGASDMKRNKNLPADFSNYGKTTVDVFAPGYELVSTAPENTYSLASGTSFSTPLVSGVAALIWSYYPELTATQLKKVLLDNVTYFGKRKVYLPLDGYGKRTKVKFGDLSVSGGVINAYKTYVYLLNKNK